MKYAIEHEAWNVYALEDGSTLRTRVILNRVSREGTDENGNPAYKFEYGVTTVVEPAREKENTK
jgi:hypothetical protein